MRMIAALVQCRGDGRLGMGHVSCRQRMGSGLQSKGGESHDQPCGREPLPPAAAESHALCRTPVHQTVRSLPLDRLRLPARSGSRKGSIFWQHHHTPRSAGRRHLKAARAGCDMMPPVKGANERLSTLPDHSFTPRSRDAFAITLTEDSAMAAAAMIGDSRMPKNGYSTPAATGMPSAL